jgi:ArsR family transcriptional regulator
MLVHWLNDKVVDLESVAASLLRVDNTWRLCQIANTMNRERFAKLNVKAHVLKAMAHPSRLCIVEELAKHERCVCELTEMIGADMSTVSKHLTVLKQAGIVADEKRGAMVFYRLRVPCLGKLFESVESVLECSARELTKASK